MLNEPKQWNAFIQANGPRSGAFLQSWAWGEFQKGLGKEIRRMKNEGNWCAQMVKYELGLGFYYWYCPRGPILNIECGTRSPAGRVLNMDFFTEVKSETKGSFVFRFDPPLNIKHQTSTISSPRSLQPTHTLLTDLTPTEDQLLKQMHYKTRYNIRLAERKGVTVKLVPYASRRSGEEVTSSEIILKEFDHVWPLFKQTAKRDGIRIYPKSYYVKLLETTSDPNFQPLLAIAEHNGISLATALCIDFAGTRTYLHGASNYEYRKLMGPYALHWHLLQTAKQKNFHTYDWWGIAPTDESNEPWAGVTRFKKGFGGEVVSYPRTKDMILKPFLYTFYKLFRKLCIK